MMHQFNYKILAKKRVYGEYLKYLLVTYGLNYNWEVETADFTPNNTFIISVSQNMLIKGILTFPCIDYIITVDKKLLSDFNIKTTNSLGATDSWGYVINNLTNCHFTDAKQTILCPLRFFRILQELPQEWNTEAYVIGQSSIPMHFIVSHKSHCHHKTIVVVFDLISFLEESLLGCSQINNNKFESWADLFGENTTQGIANQCYVDEMINLIVEVISSYYSEAFPVRIDYYPINKTAPIIISGDSDNVSPKQLRRYIEVIESHQVVANILIKDFFVIRQYLLKNSLKMEHNFGLHPYSYLHSGRDFFKNFHFLAKEFQLFFTTPITATRNHNFQFIDKYNMIREEALIKCLFDLNCVAASGHTWIGTGSGVGFPIPFPPGIRDNIFYSLPLHLPTIIEDDVFLYSYEYCYVPFITDVYLPFQQCIRYLQDWIFLKKKPATLNLHPEHVSRRNIYLLEKILNWINIDNVWTPSFSEFYEWLKKRHEVTLTVVQVTENSIILKVNSNATVMLLVNHKLAKNSKTEIKIGETICYINYNKMDNQYD